MSKVEVFPQPEVAVPADAEVGEGPVFDHRTGRLCWVDITQGMVFETELATGEQHSAHFDTMVGAIAPRATGDGFAVAVSDGFGFVHGDSLVLVDEALPEPHRRMNDAKCDSAGRLWAGSTHLEFVPGEGALHCWDGERPSEQKAKGLILPNGLGWSPDDRTMYLADSFAQTLLRAEFDATDGEVGEFTELCRVEGGFPDGLAVDADGCLWVAIWDGAEVRRFSPAGELIGVVPMPVGKPSSCAFADDGTLYITSARAGLTAEELALEPHAGSVFALPTTTRGMPVRAFRG